jgi:hypothetical protein
MLREASSPSTHKNNLFCKSKKLQLSRVATMKQCRISRDALIAPEMKKARPIRKLLAANRSEIAIRIFRAAN